MRINPISMTGMRISGSQNVRFQNQNNQSQNVSFGKVEDEKAKAETERIMTEPNSYEDNRADSEFDIKNKKDAMKFLGTTPYVTVKHNCKLGLTYLVADRESYADHEFKSDFDEIFDEQIEWNKTMQNDFDNGKRYPAIRHYLPVLEKRLIELEPDFLMPLYDNKLRKQVTDKDATFSHVCHAAVDVSRLEKDICNADRDFVTRVLDECKRLCPCEFNRFIDVSKRNADEKTISFIFVKDPFNKNEKPAKNLGRIKRFLFDRELKGRQRNDEKYHIIVKEFEKEHGLKSGWAANIDCKTEAGIEQLKLIVRLNDLLYDTFFPIESAPREEKWWEDPYERGQTLGY